MLMLLFSECRIDVVSVKGAFSRSGGLQAGIDYITVRHTPLWKTVCGICMCFVCAVLAIQSFARCMVAVLANHDQTASRFVRWNSHWWPSKHTHFVFNVPDATKQTMNPPHSLYLPTYEDVPITCCPSRFTIEWSCAKNILPPKSKKTCIGI